MPRVGDKHDYNCPPGEIPKGKECVSCGAGEIQVGTKCQKYPNKYVCKWML